MFNKNVRRTISIFLLLTLYVGLCFEAAALEEMEIGDIHEFEGGYSIKVETADVDTGEAEFVLYEDGRAVDETTVRSGKWFSLDDGGIFHFEAILDYVYRSDHTIMVHLADYNWERATPAPTPTAPWPAPTPTPGPDFSFFLIIFLVFSLAIGLPLIYIIYRIGKPPSGGPKQQKPPKPEDYAQKIEEYRAKMEEWEKEGYDVSELKEVLEGKK